MTYQHDILGKIRKQRILHDVSLELTYRCNLDCFFCYNDLGKTGSPLSMDQYRTLLQDLACMQTMYLMLTGGEPMIHPHFFEIGRLARDLGFVLRVRTNGHNLFSRACKRLHDEVDPYVVEVSLHGATADTHDRQTRVPGSFDRLIKNIRIATRTGLRINAVTTPTAWNEHQIDEMFALCDSLEVPLRFQGPVAPRDNGDTEPLEIQPSEEAWNHITELVTLRRGTGTAGPGTTKGNGIEEESEREEPSTCSVGVSGVDIDPYGNVQACMHLQESAGNLHDQSIEEIWNNSPLFLRARERAVSAAREFGNKPLRQLGAPLFCLAVEENCGKTCTGGGCGRRQS